MVHLGCYMRDMPLQVMLYKTHCGNEPVRDWFKELSKTDKRRIGEDIKTVQYGWPLGMPVVRKLEKDIWEIRSRLDKRTSRILITMYPDCIVVLHAFIKKTQKTPMEDIELARQRLREIKGGQLV
jgi:phage-related protein